MDKGKLIQAGKPIELLFRPENSFVTEFLSAQRMQLELDSVLLKDVWPYLQDSYADNVDGTEIDDNKSLREAIEALNLQKNKLLFIKKSLSDEVRLARYDSLFAALDTLKEKRP
jgi:osmoprotectant transport system ATP-binding protein